MSTVEYVLINTIETWNVPFEDPHCIKFTRTFSCSSPRDDPYQSEIIVNFCNLTRNLVPAINMWMEIDGVKVFSSDDVMPGNCTIASASVPPDQICGTHEYVVCFVALTGMPMSVIAKLDAKVRFYCKTQNCVKPVSGVLEPGWLYLLILILLGISVVLFLISIGLYLSK